MMAGFRRLWTRRALADGRQQELTHTPSQIRAILDTLQEGVLSVNPTGQVLLSNQAARHLLGIEAIEWDGRPVWELVRQPSLQQMITQVLRDGAPQRQELSIFNPEERIVYVHAASGHASQESVVVVLHDVTELRRLERVRQDFVANVSHELRTPLTSVKGFIETLLSGAIDDPAHNRPFLRLVEEDVNRLARLTDDLLELSKAESLGKPKSLQAVDVTKTIQEVVQALTSQIRVKRLSVTIDQSGLVPFAKGDPDQLRQVFWNLLDNAVKYNVEGGSVTVRLRYHKVFLYTEVKDSGIGIPLEDLSRIFERFYRVDKARSRALGGTGLGLAIVKHIVEAHGGEVGVESSSGVGSIFRVRLPVWTAKHLLS